jgi:hypothetical protein
MSIILENIIEVKINNDLTIGNIQSAAKVKSGKINKKTA